MEPTTTQTDIKAYVPGYPDKFSTYPVTVAVSPVDEERTRVQVRFSFAGKNYENAMEVKPQNAETVPLATRVLLGSARKHLAKLGALVWPPPLTDLKAWGIKAPEPGNLAEVGA